MWNSNRRFQIMKKNPLPTHRRGKCTHRKDAHSQWKKAGKGGNERKTGKAYPSGVSLLIEWSARCPMSGGTRIPGSISHETRQNEKRAHKTCEKSCWVWVSFYFQIKKLKPIASKWNEMKRKKGGVGMMETCRGQFVFASFPSQSREDCFRSNQQIFEFKLLKIFWLRCTQKCEVCAY